MVERFELDFHGLYGEDAYMAKAGNGEFVRYSDYAALEAQLAARTGGMKVKPLEWEEIHQRRSDEDPTTEVVGYEAGIPGLWWRIDVEASDFSLTFPDYSYRTVATLEAAKAAAQADFERRILAALEPAAPEGQQPVAYPKIMYCCEYCREHSPETCGYDRTDIYVMPDGRWLCGDCASEDCANDQPVDDLPHPPLLYTRPSEQAVTEALKAALETMNRYCRAGHGDDVFMDDLCRSIRKAESALKATTETEE